MSGKMKTFQTLNRRLGGSNLCKSEKNTKVVKYRHPAAVANAYVRYLQLNSGDMSPKD